MDIETLFEMYDVQSHKADCHALSPDTLHGYLTALCCGPVDRAEPEKWLPGCAEKPMPDSLKKVLVQILDLNRTIIDDGEMICFCRYYEENGKEKTDAAGWAQGFLLGMKFFEGIPDYDNDEDIRKLIDPIRFLAGDTTGFSDVKIKTLGAMQKELVDELEYVVMDVFWHARERYFGEEFED